MFDYSSAHWIAFLGAAILLNVSPGPDIAFILGQTARGGRAAGFAAMPGIWTGALVHVALAAAGLSAILAASATAFSIVKWVGAAYLVWLGIEALRSRGGHLAGGEGPQPGPAWRIWRQGVLVATLNPKVAVFFLAFLPQFVVDGAGPVAAQLVLHGILIVVVAAFVEPPLVLAGDRLMRTLRRTPRVSAWLDRALGAVLVTLAVRLALSER